MKWLELLIKEYKPGYLLYSGDQVLLWLVIIKGFLIGICFGFIGIACLVYAKEAAVEPGARMRKIFTQMSGFVFLCCGISRLLDTLCLWHNLAYLASFIGVCTGIISLITMFYVPKVVKAIRSTKSLEEVSKDLQETRNKVDKLKETTDKITGGK